MIWNPDAETAAPAARRGLQLERLRRAVAWAAGRVPVYPGALARARGGGAALASLDDLRRLPFTRKQDLRDHYPDGLFAVPRERLRRLHASSGTKGKPTVVGYTANDLGLWREVMARSLCMAGAVPGDLIQV